MKKNSKNKKGMTLVEVIIAMVKSIIDYLSGMSDAYILKIFNEFISFS